VPLSTFLAPWLGVRNGTNIPNVKAERLLMVGVSEMSLDAVLP
jgi:hypothetical protein